jgi:hypothetical protein
LHPSDNIKAWKLEGYPRWEAVYYLVPLLLFDWVYPRRKLDEPPPSMERVFFDVVGALVVYDLLFFFAHVARHKVGLSPKTFKFKCTKNLLEIVSSLEGEAKGRTKLDKAPRL